MEMDCNLKKLHGNFFQVLHVYFREAAKIYDGLLFVGKKP